MPSPWSGDVESKPAPGRLRLVQALINTVDRESGQDRLADPTDATDWLAGSGLLGAGSTLTQADLQEVTGVREALRALAIANAGGPAPDDTAMTIIGAR